MKSFKVILVALLLLVAGRMVVKAETADKVEVSAGADLVSSYVWRGIYQGQTGPSIQPSLSVSAYGFSLGAWGSTAFDLKTKEFDLALFYRTHGLSVGVTDYWWEGQGGSYFKYADSHLFEGTVSYEFTKLPLYASWSTVFAGQGDQNAEGKSTFSSYLELGYGFKAKVVDCMLTVGISPWESAMYGTDRFEVMSVALKATREIPLSATYSLPVFVQAIFSPAKEDAHLVFGITF